MKRLLLGLIALAFAGNTFAASTTAANAPPYAGSATITGGTINGAVIGGTTPAAITGTTITATTKFLAGDGSIGAPGYGFSSDSDVGMHYVSANSGALVANSNDVLLWDGASVYVDRLYLSVAAADAYLAKLGTNTIGIGVFGSTANAGHLSLTNLTAAGTVTAPNLNLSAVTGSSLNGTQLLLFSNSSYTLALIGSELRVRGDAGILGWNSTNTSYSSGLDIAFSRLGVGSLALGTGTVGSFAGNLKLTNLEAVGALVTATLTPLAADACTAGKITWDASYVYVCTATGVWKRAALTGSY